MKQVLSSIDGRIVRAVALYLSNEGKHSMTAGGGTAPLIVESIESRPWSSLTFTGERHRLVARLPRYHPPAAPICGEDIAVHGRLVAIEEETWRATPDGAVLTLDLLTVRDDAGLASRA